MIHIELNFDAGQGHQKGLEMRLCYMQKEQHLVLYLESTAGLTKMLKKINI